MSIMDLFRSQPKSAEPVPPTVNGQQQTPANPGLTQTATPDLNAVTVAPTGMDKFNDLWAPKAKVEGAPEDFNPNAIFNMDPKAMSEAIGQINFAEAVSQEDLKAITEGGDGAMQAFMKAMNSVSSKTMTLATTASAKMIEQAMGQATTAMDGRISKQVKINQVNSAMQELNPALSHPAAAPMVQALKQQFTDKFPLATPAEISAQVTEYMQSMFQLAAGKKEDAPKPADQSTDWSKYLS